MRRPAMVALCVLAAVAPARAQRVPADPPIDSLLQWARRDPYDARAAFALGMGYWRRRRYDRADSAFQRALRLDPHSAEARLAAAVLPYGRGARYQNDLEHRLSPDSMEALTRRWTLLHREAYRLDPLVDPRILKHLSIDQLVPRRTLGEVEPGSSLAPGPLWWEPRVKKGVVALVEGAADSAFALLDGVLNAPRMRQGATLPDIVVWYYGLAAAHAGRYDHAAAAFLELSQRLYRRQTATPEWAIPGQRADHLYLYGVMSERAGHSEVAIAAFQQALEEDLGLFEAHSHLADLHESRGERERALVERTRAVDASPGSARLYFDLGAALLRAGRNVEAESALMDAARLLPDDAAIQRALAGAALRNGHADLAKAALAHFIEVAPARDRAEVDQARLQLAQLP